MKPDRDEIKAALPFASTLVEALKKWGWTRWQFLRFMEYMWDNHEKDTP